MFGKIDLVDSEGVLDSRVMMWAWHLSPGSGDS